MSPDLRRRIAFTLGALLIYYFGSTVQVPGLDSILVPGLDRGVRTHFFHPRDGNLGIHWPKISPLDQHAPGAVRRAPATPGGQNQ